MRSIVPFACLCALAFAPTGGAENTPEAVTPVLIELFTSEGCSSCPPADRQIAKLVRVQPLKQVRIIALSEHVDYWNSLGWRDPFSSAAFTDRQRAYATSLGTDVYTPQLVVDGTDHLVGNDRDETMKAIFRAARRPKIALDLNAPVTAEGSLEFEVTVGSRPEEIRGKLVLWTALAEDGLVVEVARGENSGRELSHDGVARRLESHGPVEPGETRGVSFEIDPAWNVDNLRVVAFLERARDGRIVGIATSP